MAAGAVAGGLVVAVWPQHAASVVALGAATVVVVLAVVALVVVGPLAERDVPVTELDTAEPVAPPRLDPPGLRDARRDLAAATRGPVPGVVWERLVVAAVLRLQRRGVDIDSPRTREQGRALLRPETWRLLTTPPARGGRAQPASVAATVHRTLDELDELATTSRSTP